MRCPFCGHEESQVKDSRSTDDDAAIRRRRQCNQCGARFTTFERVQLRELIVIKKSDGERQPFERSKVERSLRLALRKRPIDEERIEAVVNSIVRQLESLGENEITTKQIGEYVMDALLTLDHVGYVRYASVYKDFREPDDFNEFIDNLRQDNQKSGT
ncbi:MAG: transcriptional regulator NrdR [Alphaproteobacteria bacterium]|nr:transcriptional regulator NrdR [Alphaproteobacteria bacterium]